MKNSKDKSLWQKVALSGAAAAIVYTLHVIIGGALWDGYSHVRQTISELTGNGAPNAEMLKIFTVIYGILALVFSVSVYVLFWKYNVHRWALIGAALLILMEFTSLVGYSLFPLEDGGAVLSAGNLMHLAVTAIVALSAIGAIFAISLGLLKTPYFRSIGMLSLFCAVIVTLSGIATPIVLGNELGISGAVERINIFALQIWLFALSIFLFTARFPKKSALDLERMGLIDVYRQNGR